MQRKPVPTQIFPARRVGTQDKHHFFGYYDKTPWDRSDRYLLANEAAMMSADLTPELVAGVGFFDLHEGGRYLRCSDTTAWNWQMGCQLQWLDGAPRRQFIYNTRTADGDSVYPGFGSEIYDVESGTTRRLPLPIYVVAPSSAYALCVDYGRLYVTHQTIGYAEAQPRRPLGNAPASDGIHWMDLATGAARMLVSYQDLRGFHPLPSMERAIHWVSHIEINPSSSRILFLHRWTERVEDETCFLHRLITINPDGSGMRLLECSDHPLPQLVDGFDPAAVGTFDYEKSEYQISHPMWRDDEHIIVWSPHAGRIHYHLYRDSDSGEVEVVGADVLVENGHMSYSPIDPRWLLTDTYPDDTTKERTLVLFDTQSDAFHDIGRFYADPALGKENRCDLHPRWSRDGRQVCIDSVHESERQMYVIDVSKIVAPSARPDSVETQSINTKE